MGSSFLHDLVNDLAIAHGKIKMAGKLLRKSPPTELDISLIQKRLDDSILALEKMNSRITDEKISLESNSPRAKLR